ncbi:hypothetical protein [Aurantibacter sp.]|uniref:SGNH/GDSL hydrolase family protein n=1 Tax=Aurantibacter sp. TaxID=2807103 RepID=UPI0032671E80
MKNSTINKFLLGLVIILGILLVYFYINKKKENKPIESIRTPVEKTEVLQKELHNFSLTEGEEYQLIDSAIKQNFRISFNGVIEKFDSLIIGKGSGRYLTSNLLLTKDSIIFNKVTNVETRKGYKHNLKLQNNITINIDRTVDSSSLTVINEKDTLKFNSDFVGMNNPFVRSSGSVIHVDTFSFNSPEYSSDIFVFGDSYVNIGSTKRWPYYIYNANYNFLCDGLPGGKSVDSYSFFNAAISIHKPKYVVWCLGMNDKSDVHTEDKDWKKYAERVMEVCEQNNISLILSTIPSVPSRNHKEKNKFVRESGYRFIDFDKAVSDGKGNWNKDLLASDEVHPTALGAKTLAEQFIIDFPEINNFKKLN